MSSRPERRVPRATYRVQLSPSFGFEKAAALASYLARLGVSHLYCSPYLQAAPGSTHGYDVVDHSRVNEELGGQAGHARMLSALADQGLGQVLDIVPNHMAIDGRQNRWWWDVLENGTSSRYATYFDVSWDPPERKLRNTILMPVLSDHYGRVLEAGQLRLGREGGRLLLRYRDHTFPIDPRSYGVVLDGKFAQLASEFAALPVCAPGERDCALDRHRAVEALIAQLQGLDAGESLDALVEEVNRDVDRLDLLLDHQNYRLARWQTAGFELDYRRFFDVNDLAGVRVEDPEVFMDTHALVLDWLAGGRLEGVRVDHPDGLRDPQGYFDRLAAAVPQAWVVAEKVLERHESLPREWRVAGTTGYDFLNLVLGLFVDARAKKVLTDLYVRFTGEISDYRDLVYQKKQLAMHELLASDLNRLTALFVRVCESNRRYRDYTRRELLDCLRETIACLRVYRTYARPGQGPISAQDRRRLNESFAEARRRRPDLDPELFTFLARILALEVEGEEVAELVWRFQQTSGAVAAKGVEDTAFYVYNRFVALNEVGGDPSRFGVSVAEFHAECKERARRRPEAMLATSTHDTKRSEDVRARLAVLSELPGAWQRAVRRWMTMNKQHRRRGLPDANTEYLLYQTLVGAWPLAADRAVAYIGKATREAKVHTSWLAPIPEYDGAVRDFTEALYTDAGFQSDLARFAGSLVEPGRINSLAMKLLCLTAPGIPDVYQGSEIWDLSLVDPDNRRPVDYGERAHLLDQLEGLGAAADVVWKRQADGLPKLLVVQRALQLRAERPELFSGSYEPLPLVGAHAAHAVAFCRGGGAVTLVPRLVTGLRGGWGGTAVQLPPGQWRNHLTGETVAGGEAAVQAVLGRFPVALLERSA